ncbi:MAG: glutaredoxin family protein [Gammaproteobacteria bacterium]|nr:glutaredoxin family protein [Gammaproteobacteria bacterium]
MTGFRVYIRHGCHLCEDLLEQLRLLQQQHHFEIELVNIDADPELVRQYGTLVPVVTLGEQQICHYFLDQAALLQALGSTDN